MAAVLAAVLAAGFFNIPLGLPAVLAAGLAITCFGVVVTGIGVLVVDIIVQEGIEAATCAGKILVVLELEWCEK